METCIIGENRDLQTETPIYKYLSMEAFLFLLRYKTRLFSKLSSWPDAFEGARFEFFKQIKNEDEYSNKTTDYFFGSSWTLQTENSCFYEDPDEHKKAEEELCKSGSASMWENYCKNGGLRIKTTIGKIEAILNQQANDYKCYKGEVHYEPSGYWKKTLSTSGLISKLFIKRVSFRHESEYRFILVANENKKTNQLFFDIGRPYDFVDEFLVSPAISNNVWIARMLYHYAVSTSISPDIVGTNHKNGEQYCRISNLYGNISHEI
jgi:hypothetical protein